ncbi:3-oxoacyl-ACP reductase FabG [Buchnera aphidicola]|uniref:3-oxoacyl-ACP reductase FabG n=1 Tax=Buchnera aphidicola TaxID=9 RepID=UPI00346435AF
MITGANTGIGKNIAQYFVQKNIIVIGTATSMQGVTIIKKYLHKKGTGIILNLKDLKSIKLTIKNIYKKYGSIDILINNASVKFDKLLFNMTEKEWIDTLTINLTSIFYTCKSVVRYMIKKKYGRIISIGSVIGDIGNIGQINYSTTKAGLIGFNKSLALEIARFGITANIISPGIINTGMLQKLSFKQKQEYLFKIPLKRFGSPQDISNAALFLSSNKASYITGQTIHVNGGMYLT